MRYRNAISYAILLVIAYDIKDIANAIKKISHEISLRYRNDAISHAISHLTRIQMKPSSLQALSAQSPCRPDPSPPQALADKSFGAYDSDTLRPSLSRRLSAWYTQFKFPPSAAHPP